MRESVTDGLLERELELGELRRLVDAARGGIGRAMVIEGPAGIGKTRLLTAVRELAAERGLTVLRARGGELERDFPFGIVRQLFEPVLGAAKRRERERLLAGAAALAGPLLIEGVGAPPPSDGDGSYAARHGLYWLTANLAERAALLIAVDDLQWADPPSLGWLAYLTRRLEGLPIVLVLAARTHEPGVDRRLLDELVTDATVSVLRPGPLGTEAVAELVRAELDPQVGDELCRACHAATGGNPFLMRELLADLTGDGGHAPADPAGIARLRPSGVTRMVRGRLRRLPADALALARAVAILGEAVELRHATELADLDSGPAAEALDALVSVDILRAGPPLEFVHPLVRSAIAADIPSRERLDAHAQAARLLTEAGSAPDQVAVHLLAAPAGEDPWVLATLHAAATHALAHGAASAGVAYLRRALAEPPAAGERADVLLELGSAEARVHDPAAREHLGQAFERFDDPERAGEAALELSRVLMLAGQIEEAIDALDRAAAALEGAGGELALRLEAERLAAAWLAHGDLVPAAERTERFRALAGETPAERFALAILAAATTFWGGAADVAADYAQRALAGARLAEENSIGLYYAVNVLTLAERFEAAGAVLDRTIADARARGSVLHFMAASGFRAMLAYRRGQVLDAEADARQALELAGEGGALFVPVALGFLVSSLIERGELELAERELERIGPQHDLADSFQLGALLEARGRLRVAQGRVRDGMRDFYACRSRGRAWRWRPDAAIALVTVGERGAARALAREELAWARGWGTPRAVGITLNAAGRVESRGAGLELLGQAVAVLEGSQAPLEHGRALIDLGAALRRAGQRARARPALRRGLDLAQRCGATALVDQAQDELVAAGARPRRAPLSGRDALTASERRVAQLAADGLTNREIAQSLFVTEKTVEGHLGSAYRKLEIGSRVQLARALAPTAGQLATH